MTKQQMFWKLIDTKTCAQAQAIIDSPFLRTMYRVRWFFHI